MGSKRNGYISWDQYFMGVAELAAMRSKDPSTQVGACIVDQENKIASTGYNGMPVGCSDDEFPWGKTAENDIENKYMYVVHSELNAILNYRGESLKGCTLYVTMFPCNECAKAIIQAGIRKVIFREDAYRKKPSGVAAERMFRAAGVGLVQQAESDRFVKIRI